jgi:hypothetical protein
MATMYCRIFAENDMYWRLTDAEDFEPICNSILMPKAVTTDRKLQLGDWIHVSIVSTEPDSYQGYRITVKPLPAKTQAQSGM